MGNQVSANAFNALFSGPPLKKERGGKDAFAKLFAVVQTCVDCGNKARKGKHRCRQCQRMKSGVVGIRLTRPDPDFPNIPVGAW